MRKILPLITLIFYGCEEIWMGDHPYIQFFSIGVMFFIVLVNFMLFGSFILQFFNSDSSTDKIRNKTYKDPIKKYSHEATPKVEIEEKTENDEQFLQQVDPENDFDEELQSLIDW